MLAAHKTEFLLFDSDCYSDTAFGYVWQASRNDYGNTPAMTATEPDCKQALSAVILGGEAARLKLAEEVEAAAAEAEAARLEAYMQKQEV